VWDSALPLTGDALLEAVSESMAVLHERYYHRRPVSVTTRLMSNELLACVMGGAHTDVEQTIVDLGRQTIVQQGRSAFQDAMGPRFISEVERLSGRRVLMFISNSHVGPDLAIELFVLAPAA
jgi:uncharacterized protein YbcI